MKYIKGSSINCKGSICREDLIDILNSIGGKEARNGKHYINIDFLIRGVSEGELMNCECTLAQRKEDWGKPKNVLFQFRTLENHRAFMDQLAGYREELSEHRVYQEENNGVDNINDLL